MSNLYLEVDEDITSAIEKLAGSESHEVRIVVPKRSGLLSSLINLKLLKKAAHDHKKKLVLVTTDPTITSLASRVDLPVAENVTAHAEVPSDKAEPKGEPDIVEEEEEHEEEPEAKPAVLESPEAGAADVGISHRPAPGHDAPAEKPAKHKKESGFKIPNFGSLQKRVMLMSLVALGLIGLFVLNFLFKKAEVTIFAKGTQIPSEVSFKAVTTGAADPAKGEVAAEKLKLEKNVSNSFTATGKKDVGSKASGSVSIKNCEDTSPHSFAAGSTVTAQGKNFVTSSAAAIPAGSFSGGGTVCTSSAVSVDVTAAANGDSYNLAPTSYSSNLGPNFKITGNQMSGGTSKTLTIVSQADVNSAKEKLTAADDKIRSELAQKAGDSQIAARDTLAADVGNISSSPAVGSEANSFTLAGPVTYTMMAFSQNDLEKLVKSDVMSKLGQDNVVYSTGVEDAAVTAGENGQFGMKTTVFAGAKIDQDAVKKSIKGKKVGSVKTIVESTPGVDHADISFWPFWSSAAPRITSHIHIQIKVESSP